MFKVMKDLLAGLFRNRIGRLYDRRKDAAAAAEFVDPVLISVQTDDRPGDLLLRKYVADSLRLVRIRTDKGMDVRVRGKDLPYRFLQLFLVLAAHVFFDLTDHIRVSEHHIPERIRGI